MYMVTNISKKTCCLHLEGRSTARILYTASHKQNFHRHQNLKPHYANHLQWREAVWNGNKNKHLMQEETFAWICIVFYVHTFLNMLLDIQLWRNTPFTNWKQLPSTVEKIQGTRFEVFTAVKIQITVFWFMTPCSVVVRYEYLRGPCCLHLQGEHTTILHGVTTQKTSTWICRVL
jgi:hypothetical protein